MLSCFKLPFIKRIGVRSSIFALNFALSKIVVYISPLIIAAIAGPRLYGAIEFSMAIGLQLSALFLGAPLSGITQKYLIDKDENISDILLLITSISIVLGISAFLLGYLSDLSVTWMLAIASLPASIIQNTASTWYRIKGRINISTWTDGFSSLSFLTVISIAVFIMDSRDYKIITIMFLLFAIVCLLLTIASFCKRRRSHVISRIKRVCRIGFPMMIVGALATWLGVGGRILFELLLPQSAAAYGLAFRMCGISLGVYQLFTTALFVNLYIARTRFADRILAIILFLSGVASIIMYFIGKYITIWMKFDAVKGGDVEVYQSILPWTSAQIFFWIGYAMLQTRINRYGLAAKAIFPTALLTFTGIIVIYTACIIYKFSAEDLSIALFVHTYLFFLLNSWILIRRKLPHFYVLLVGMGFSIVLLGILMMSLYL